MATEPTPSIHPAVARTGRIVWNFGTDSIPTIEKKTTSGLRVSDAAARAMRWIGGIVLGLMLAGLSLFWHALLDEPIAILLYIIPPSTIGVLLCFLGWVSGYFNRLMDLLREVRRERSLLRQEMQAMVTDVELDHVRREHAIKDMLESVVDQLRVVVAVQAEQANAIQHVHEIAVRAKADQGDMAVAIGELCAKLDGNIERVGRVDQVVRQCLGVLRPKATKQQNGVGRRREVRGDDEDLRDADRRAVAEAIVDKLNGIEVVDRAGRKGLRIVPPPDSSHGT